MLKYNIRFDENIKGFHHYDLKFTLDCHFAGMNLTTAPIHVIHESPGLVNTTDEYLSSEEYIFNFLKDLSRNQIKNK